MTPLLFSLALLVAAPPAPAVQSTASTQTDRDAVQQAALDYADGIYLVDPKRIERSVHPQLTKRGFWREPAAPAYGQQLTMTYDQLVALAGSWNRDGKQNLSVKKVEVHEVLDQTATAKVTASWGIDHLQLAKYDGRWKIINILWQAHPK